MAWVDACSANAIEVEGAVRFDHDGLTFAIYRNHLSQYFCTDGLCTHENVHLSDGMVVENTVECPKHSSIFNVITGEVETPPACENLRTYSVKIDNDRILINIP